MWEFGLKRIDNIAGKGENDGCRHFLLFRQCFQKLTTLGLLNSQDCAVKC